MFASCRVNARARALRRQPIARAASHPVTRLNFHRNVRTPQAMAQLARLCRVLSRISRAHGWLRRRLQTLIFEAPNGSLEHNDLAVSLFADFDSLRQASWLRQLEVAKTIEACRNVLAQRWALLT